MGASTHYSRICYSMCGRYDDSNVLRFEAVCDVSIEAVYTVRVYTMEIVVRPRTPVAACDLCQSVTIVCLDCTEDRNLCVSTKDEEDANWCARGMECTHLSGCSGCGEHPCMGAANTKCT